jgi:suppressor of G2 allele of SKP1
MADLEKKAKEAFIDDHFELAVDLYTQAIALNPTNPDLFADRSQANIKLNNFTGNLTVALTGQFLSSF